MSISSCRLDAIARDEYLTKVISEFNSEGIVVAIEGISNEIRRFLQKGIMEEDILIAIENIFKENIKRIKLYYIYTGRETDEDIKEFEEFLKTLDQFKREYKRESMSILFSFTYLTPTLYTALQYNPPKDIEESLIDTENALVKINRIIVTYGFDFKVSISRACNDIIEFTDRRAASLFEYVSLNGIHMDESYSISFYDGEVQISKDEFLEEKGNKLQIEDKYFKVKYLDRMTSSKIYKLINENKIHSEINLKEINGIFEQFNGKRIKHKILDALGRRKKSLENKKIHIEKNNTEEFISVIDNNKKQIKTIQVAFGTSKLVVDFIRNWLPVFTGGVSHTDIIQEKNASYIFPHFHIKFHDNRHMGFHYFKYASIKKGLFDSYCLNGMLSRCVECGSCSNKTETTQRAVLKASNGELIESLLHNKTWSTRKKYISFEREYVSLLSGKIIYEMQFNGRIEINEEYIKHIERNINKFTTEGWKIDNIKLIELNERTINLKSKIDFTDIECKFDTKKVKVPELGDLIKRFNRPDFIMKCERRDRVSRNSIKNTLDVFNKNQVRELNIRSKIGKEDITCLGVILKSQVNPIIFLDGFLGNVGQGYIRKIDVRVKDFFTERKFKSLNSELIRIF
jgi:hypothetical protein